MAAAGLAGAPAGAIELSGPARVVDGDTVIVGDRQFGLYGIRAPALDETCPRPGGGRWPCGQAAAEALRRRIGDRPVSCDLHGPNHARATCYQGGEDLNAWMVRNGWAWADRTETTVYAASEGRAAGTAAGLWARDSIPLPLR